MNELTDAWKKYNRSAEILKEELGRTSNLVGEYAEHLANKYLNGELLKESYASADIKTKNGELYQVKARKISKSTTTQLGIIRSWDFDYLAVILFDKNGEVIKSIITPKNIAKMYARENKHQRGWVISTTKKFIYDAKNNDITESIKNLNK